MKQQHWTSWLGSAALGAAAMYFSDPGRGRRRRALALDKLTHARAKAARGADVALRDMNNRLIGFRARTRRSLFQPWREEALDDQVIAARVRARLGRFASHPHAVKVTVQQGRVHLSGPVLNHERDKLVDVAYTVPGVMDVEDGLEAHKRPEHISSLQGGSGRAGMHSEFMQEHWAPALRAATVLGGGALGSYGLARRTPATMALAAAGLLLFMRGLTNMPVRRIAGIEAGHRAVDLQKTIEITAPPETVFDVWAAYENFPRFMSHVLEVRDLGEKRSHWIVQGPMGRRLEWNATLTEHIRPAVLAWKTDPGSTVEHAGLVRFEPTERGTRAFVRLSYNPPAGLLGHGLALLLGRDPKHELDDDLMRMKSFIETGVLPHDAAASVIARRQGNYRAAAMP